MSAIEKGSVLLKKKGVKRTTAGAYVLAALITYFLKTYLDLGTLTAFGVGITIKTVMMFIGVLTVIKWLNK